MSAGKASGAVRLAIAAVVIIAGAYWAGGRWGQTAAEESGGFAVGNGGRNSRGNNAGHTSLCARCGADGR